VLIHHAADRLLADGHEVVLLLDMSEPLFRRFMERDRLSFAAPERLRAERVDALCGDFPYARAAVPCPYQWKSLRFAHALRALCRTTAVDHVEFFDYCGPGYYAAAERLFAEHPGVPGARPTLACRVHGSIEVLDRHGDGLVKDRDHFLLHSFERRALALAETVLVPSRAYYERYYKDLYRLPPERVVVSSPPKQPFPRVARRPTPADPFTIAFVGRMFHLKGVDQLVHAAVMLMKRRPDLRCTVDLMGYDSHDGPLGSYSAYLRTLIPARLRDRFLFPGQVPHEAVAARLNNALFAVFPNRIESFCYALHEVYDAGVPVIVNPIPAFQDFFRHEHNALCYDGTTRGLLARMEQMIDDDVLRERLGRPCAVGEDPLGPYYATPGPRRPVDAPTPHEAVRPLAVVLCRDDRLADCPALNALAAQTSPDITTLALVPATPDDEETLWWLGRPWHVRDGFGRPLEPSDILTTDALVVLQGTDRPHPTWVAACRRALSRRPDIAFAGTWAARNGTPVPGLIDVAPELHPFECGPQLARVMLRTAPGQPITDLFDHSLGTLGHTGLVWSAIASIGHGCLLPQPLIEIDDAPAPPDPSELRSLLLRCGAAFAGRLCLLAGIVAGPPPAPPPPLNGVSVETKIKYAGELGGRLLARLAWKKLKDRATGRTPP
jgi:glycosyltransferase involved in cell wall biosynthesis